jgi:hypothetical protein
MLSNASIFLFFYVTSIVNAKPNILMKLGSFTHERTHEHSRAHIMSHAKLLSCSPNNCLLIKNISIDAIPEFNCDNQNLAITVYMHSVRQDNQIVETTAKAFLPPITNHNLNNNMLEKGQNISTVCRKIRR